MEHAFLNLRGGHRGPAPLPVGDIKLSTKMGVFFMFGLAALVAFAVMYYYVDIRVATALENWTVSRNISAAVGSVRTGVARIKGDERQFLLKKEPNIAEVFSRNLDLVSTALDDLYKLPGSIEHQSSIDTLRDGLAQYEAAFGELIKTEEKLGVSDHSGISQRLQQSAIELKERFSAAGYENLSGQIDRISQQGEETMLSGVRSGVGEVQKRYKVLAAFLAETKIGNADRSALLSLLQRHETAMLTMINTRFTFDEVTRRFDDILAYITPGLEGLDTLSRNSATRASRDLERAQMFARYTLAGGSAAILLWLILAGMLMLRSSASSLKTMAEVASRLAKGDRNVNVPGRSNQDTYGNLARALDKWVDDLMVIDELRRDLAQQRNQLDQVIAEAESKSLAAAETARRALLAEVQKAPEPAPQTAPPPPVQPEAQPETPQQDLQTQQTEQRQPDRYRGEGSPSYGRVPGPPPGQFGSGPISTIGQQLSHYSEYVTAAAHDVERTEALIKGVEITSHQINDMEMLLMAIRDQTNLLAFRSVAGDSDLDDNLVPIKGERQYGIEQPVYADRNMAMRLDAIRETTDRAERGVQSIRLSMAEVSAVAREIASTATSQAMEATSRLQNQSEHLQNLIDGILNKIEQGKPIERPGQSRSQQDMLRDRGLKGPNNS